MIGHRPAEVVDPGLLALAEVVQHIGVDQGLVARMTDAEAQSAESAEGKAEAEAEATNEKNKSEA